VGQTEAERTLAGFDLTPGPGFHMTFPPRRKTDAPGRHPWYMMKKSWVEEAFPADYSAEMARRVDHAKNISTSMIVFF
jgi:hypothetical protein